MKKSVIFVLVILGVMAMIDSKVSLADSAAAHSIVGLSTPPLQWVKTIDLNDEGHKPYVMGLVFSPNGRHLGITEKLADGSTAVVVWDMHENKQQSRITGMINFADYPGVTLIWSPDGKNITFGFGGHKRPVQFWDPMTGRLVKEAPTSVATQSLHFNKDGSKALSDWGRGGNSIFCIYETADWSCREIDEKDMDIKALSWVGDDQVLALGFWRRNEKSTKETTASAKYDFKENDAVARLIDLSAKHASKTVLVAPSLPRIIEHNGVSRTWYEDQLVSPPFLLVDDAGDKAAIGYGRIINIKTMEVITYASVDDLVTHKIPVQTDQNDAAISPDGAYIYLKGGALPGSDEAKNLVLDANTGKPVLWFKGGHNGIAVRPDGKQLAIGDGSSVQIMGIQ